MNTYLVFRCTDGWVWRFRDGQVPGELRDSLGWTRSHCHPGNFYNPGSEHPELDEGYTVSIEEMAE